MDAITREQFLAEIHETISKQFFSPERYSYFDYAQEHRLSKGCVSITYIDYCSHSRPWLVRTGSNTFEGESFKDAYEQFYDWTYDIVDFANSRKE